MSYMNPYKMATYLTWGKEFLMPLPPLMRPCCNEHGTVLMCFVQLMLAI